MNDSSEHSTLHQPSQENGDAPSALVAESVIEKPWRPDSEFRRIDPNYVPAESIGSWIFTAIVATAAIFFLALALLLNWFEPLIFSLLAAAAVALVALLIWLTIKLPRWEYEHIQYAVGELGVEIHRGIFWRHVINVPRSRVQHTDVTQGPLARRFGIATLHVYTAGTQNNEVNLEGLAYQDALRIRSYLVGEVSPDGI